MSDEKRSGQRTPLVLRIKLRYPDVDTFVGKFATNVSRGGMFIASRKPKPVGTSLKFELQLADGSPVIAGKGVVKWVREFDENNPRQPHGMGIEFAQLRDDSEAALARVIELRRERGLDEQSIPHELAPKRAKRKTKSPSGKKKKRSKRKTKSPEQTAAPAPAPDPDPDPDPVPDAASAVPTPIPVSASDVAAAAVAIASDRDVTWTDDALAAILETTDAQIATIIERAKQIAFAGGADFDLDGLLNVAPSPVASSLESASSELASMLGAPAVPRRRRRTTPPPPPPARSSRAPKPPEPEQEPDPQPEPPLEVEPPVEEDIDDPLAQGTPPPPPPAAEPEATLRSSRQTADEPDTLLAPSPLHARGDYSSSGEMTAVQDEPPEDVIVTADVTPLPPPIPAHAQHDDFEPPPEPPEPIDELISEDLAVAALDADDLMAAIAEPEEFSEDAPTNVVSSGGDDGDIMAALDALTEEAPRGGVETRLPTDDGSVEIDLDMDLDEDTGADDPDDPEGGPKKGFFKRIFGKN
jgi:uncharacterized protein (TIGR02266 family)